MDVDLTGVEAILDRYVSVFGHVGRDRFRPFPLNVLAPVQLELNVLLRVAAEHIAYERAEGEVAHPGACVTRTGRGSLRFVDKREPEKIQFSAPVGQRHM